MHRRTFYVLECEAEGCVVELYLNDQPVERRGEGRGLGKFYNGQCNHELVPGENELTLVISPGPTPASTLRARPERPGRARRLSIRRNEEPKPGKATCKLTRYLEHEVIGSPAGELLLELSWELEPTAERHWPQVVSATVELGELWGRWAWQDAEPLTLDEQTRAEVKLFLEDLHAALSNKDLDPLIERSRSRVAEISRAYELPAGQKEEEVRKNAAFFQEQEGWGMAPLDWEQADLRLCGRRRLIECVAQDGMSLLRELPRGEHGVVNSWPLFLAKIDGRLEIVR